MLACLLCPAVLANGNKVAPYQSVKLGGNVVVEASAAAGQRGALWAVLVWLVHLGRPLPW